MICWMVGVHLMCNNHFIAQTIQPNVPQTQQYVRGIAPVEPVPGVMAACMEYRRARNRMGWDAMQCDSVTQ